MPRTVLAVAALLVAVTFCALGFLMGTRSAEARRPVAPPLERAQEAPSFAEIVERANPSVVQILVPHRRKPLRPVEDGDEGDAVRDEGSGFVIDDKGHILTNQHLVAGAERIRVRLSDKRELPGTLVGADDSTDVAVILVKTTDLRPIPLGDSDRLRIGDWVCAIGNPYSFEHTVTAGVVSSKGRKIFDQAFDDYIQTDAAINPGNSGGPLLNLRGEAVGMNAAVSLEGEGIGFAVPINLARTIVAQILRNGHVSRGYVGVEVRDLEPDLQTLLSAPEPGGSVVLDVAAGSAADKAGLARYDVITEVAAQQVAKADDFVRAISALSPGAEVELRYLRNGVPATATLTVTGRPTEAAMTAHQSSPPPPRSGPLDALGLLVREATPLRKGQRPPEGVIVREIESSAPGADLLEQGDLIVEVNRKPTPNLAAYRRVVGELATEASAWLLVRRPATGDIFLARLMAEPAEEAAGRKVR